MRNEEHYLALDIGGGYLKSARIIINKNENKIENISFKKERLEKYSGISLENLKENAGKLVEGDEKGIIFGLNSEFIKGRTVSLAYKREDFYKPIDEEEIQKITQNIESEILKTTKEQFWQESTNNEEDLKIINAKIENIFIDGYPALDLLGFQGKEIRLGVFNTFANQTIIDILESLAKFLQLPIISINHLARSRAQSLVKNNTELSAVLIDIGANISEIILVKNGLIKNIKNVLIGGANFTERISQELKVSWSEAEMIKFNYPEKLSHFFEADLAFFKQNISLLLKEMSELDILPNLFYIYGGGSLLPDVKKTLGKIISAEIIYDAEPDLINIKSLSENIFEILAPNQFSKILNKVIKLIV